MKKAMKISGIILGIILIIALVILIFFPGLFTYLSVKRLCPHIDETIGTYPTENIDLPDDFIQIEIKGLLISGPADAVYNEKEKIAFKNDDVSVMLIQNNSSEHPWYDDSDYKHFFQSIDYQTPETTVESMKFIRSITAKDCIKLRGRDLEIFEEFAVNKDSVYDSEDVYFYDNGNISGLLCDLSGERRSLNLVFDYEGYSYTVIATGTDLEMLKQIISSVQIAE